MATRDCATPEAAAATAERSVSEQIEVQRSALFDVMAIIGLASAAKDPDTEEMSRALRLCHEQLDEIAAELESIGIDVSREVANG